MPVSGAGRVQIRPYCGHARLGVLAEHFVSRLRVIVALIHVHLMSELVGGCIFVWPIDSPGLALGSQQMPEDGETHPESGRLEEPLRELGRQESRFGEDRVVYGSNWPVCERAGTFKQSIDIVKAYMADKGQAAWDKYFWRNGKDAYKWIKR